MPTDEKQEYLDKKYAYIEDEPISGKKKSKRHPPRKEKHKHDYQNCVFQYDIRIWDKVYPQFQLGSYCTICGKISTYHDDGKLTKYGFNTSWYSTILGVMTVYGHEDEIERAKERARKIYPVYAIDPWNQKYVPIVKEINNE